MDVSYDQSPIGFSQAFCILIQGKLNDSDDITASSVKFLNSFYVLHSKEKKRKKKSNMAKLDANTENKYCIRILVYYTWHVVISIASLKVERNAIKIYIPWSRSLLPQ